MTDAWRPAHQNGWYPKLSPTGRYLLYGNWRSYLVDLADLALEHVVAPRTGQRHQNVGWWSDTEYVVYAEDSHELFIVRADDRTWRLLGADPVGWNQFDCDDGHWCGSVPGCIYDGRQIDLAGASLYGARVKGSHLVAAAPARGWRMAHYIDGTLAREYPPTNTIRLSRAGDVAMGYWGPVTLARAETGVVEDATITPWRREGVPTPLRVDGVLWLWGPLEVNGDPCVMGRRYGDLDGLLLRGFPAIDVAVVVDAAQPDTVLVAGNGTDGGLQLRRVALQAPRETLIDRQPGPVDTHRPPPPLPPALRAHTKGLTTMMEIDGKIVVLRGPGGLLLMPDAPNTGTWGGLQRGWRGALWTADGDTQLRAAKLPNGRYTFTHVAHRGLAGADAGQYSPALDKQIYFKPDGDSDAGDLEQWRVYDGNENGAIEAQIEQVTDDHHPAGAGKRFFAYPLAVELVA